MQAARCGSVSRSDSFVRSLIRCNSLWPPNKWFNATLYAKPLMLLLLFEKSCFTCNYSNIQIKSNLSVVVVVVPFERLLLLFWLHYHSSHLIMASFV